MVKETKKFINFFLTPNQTKAQQRLNSTPLSAQAPARVHAIPVGAAGVPAPPESRADRARCRRLLKYYTRKLTTRPRPRPPCSSRSRPHGAAARPAPAPCRPRALPEPGPLRRPRHRRRRLLRPGARHPALLAAQVRRLFFSSFLCAAWLRRPVVLRSPRLTGRRGLSDLAGRSSTEASSPTASATTSSIW